MPKPLPRCCRLGIWNVLASRMRLQRAMLPGRSSTAATTPVPSAARHQALADDEVKAAGHGHAHLRLVAGREQVDDAIDGLGRAGRVHGAQHEVSRLARRERHAHGLGIAQLADDDDVGILAKAGLERVGERLGVRAHLPLAHHGPLARVDVLDGVFHRDDVVGRRGVEDVDDGGHRAGLAVARRTRHHDEPLVVVRRAVDLGRQARATRAWGPRAGCSGSKP